MHIHPDNLMTTRGFIDSMARIAESKSWNLEVRRCSCCCLPASQYVQFSPMFAFDSASDVAAVVELLPNLEDYYPGKDGPEPTCCKSEPKSTCCESKPESTCCEGDLWNFGLTAEPNANVCRTTVRVTEDQVDRWSSAYRTIDRLKEFADDLRAGRREFDDDALGVVLAWNEFVSWSRTSSAGENCA